MDLAALMKLLRDAQLPDGGWPYLPGQPAAAEVTVLAAAAGAAPSLSALTAASEGWAGLLLPAALHSHQPQREAADTLVKRLVTQILSAESQVVEDEDGVLGHDATLRAWSWMPGTAPWVEPTAYALLSLAACGQGEHPRAVEGRKMLLNRQCSDGGWNYGNPRVLDTDLESELGVTAWAVMALPPSDAVSRGLDRVLRVREEESTTSLSLAVLALTAHDAPLGDLPDRLSLRLQRGGATTRLDRLALGLCALHAAADLTHPFVLERR
ncbi:hypothetical protein L6R46_15025 [Myxococcota bacterium]|nr:hypothetical protein [Myxococcota bacterium]